MQKGIIEMKRLIFISVLYVLAIDIIVYCLVPNKISYQGLLSTSSGSPVVDGSYDIKFEIFNLPSGGTLRHSETQTGVLVQRGTFSIILGTVVPFTLAFNESLYVEVTAVNGPTGPSYPLTFSPRSELTSAPYSLAPWTTSGSDIYYNAGNVGIGTNQPSQPLNVVGPLRWQNSSGSVIGELNFDTGADLLGIGSSTMGYGSAALGLWSGGAERVRLDQSGNFGIGTTFPTGLLDIRGVGTDVGAVVTAGNSDLSHLLKFFSGRLNDPNPYILWKHGDPLRFATDGSGFSEKMRITSLGSVGIGTTTPAKLLTLTGSPLNEASIQLNAFWNPEIFLNAGGSDADVKLHFQEIGSDRWNLIYDGSENAINFTHYLVGTTLYLNQNGRVGIGLTDPSEMLDVNGNARLRSMGSSTGTTVVADANGKLWKQSSSRRYKNDIHPLTINNDNVLKLQPVHFRYKETGAEDIGLIAEDVDEVLKDLVIYDSEGKPDAVKYDRIAVYLLGVIKQQQKEIEYLKTVVKPLIPVK